MYYGTASYRQSGEKMAGTRRDAAMTAAGIFQEIEQAIARGEYLPGDELPSIRELAARRRVSPATVAAAFRRLADSGLTYVERGVGTKVQDQTLLADTLGRTQMPILNGIVDVASGAPDPALLPDLNVSLHRLEVGKVLYDVEPMLPSIRTHATDLMSDVIKSRPEHITITGGALESIADAIAVRLRPGDRVIVEDPGFAAATSLLRSHALTLVPVPVDDEGFEVAPFADALQHGAKAILYSPRAQNPRGSALTPQRASALRRILGKLADAGKPPFIIENDHAALISSAPYLSLTESSPSWLSARSLSKSHGPDLRFAFAAGDELTVERMQRRQALNSGWISTILQHLIADLLADPAIDTLTERATAEYDRRRARLIETLGARGVKAYGSSGLNVLVPVHDEAAVSNVLMSHGWQTRNGHGYRHSSAPFIRLTTAALADGQIDTLANDVVNALHNKSFLYR